ncbi:MAG: alpha/beta hydrolase, partial [Oscillospiraceae bacterium]|nr:alpha/beta hydrolase [Oscillospiraceae bacterium]
ALLFAEKYPERTEKLILIGCGPLKQEYLADILRVRNERREQGLDTDNYCALPGSGGDMLYFDEGQHLSLMEEITGMRKSGELLKRALQVQCPVTMIHGEYDPHPIAGSAGLLPDAKAYILPKCGHDPWKEKYAREIFIRIIKEELI